MAVTATILKAEFPEFDDTPDAIVDARIADAVLRVSTSTWGTLTDVGVKYLACHLIAMGPLGEQAKLDLKSGPDAGKSTTEYFLEYERMMRIVSSGCRTI